MKMLRPVLRPWLNIVRQSPGYPVVSRDWDSRLATTLSGLAARPLRPQIKDGAVLEPFTELRTLPGWRLKQLCRRWRLSDPSLELRTGWFWYHLSIVWLFEVHTCVFAMLKTVRLEGGLNGCPLNLKIDRVKLLSYIKRIKLLLFAI